MLWYIFLAAFPVVISLIISCKGNSIRTNDKAKRMFLFWCGLAMFLLIALRSQYVGSADSENYFNNWERLSNVSFGGIEAIAEETNMEIGYLLYAWLFSHVFPNGQFVFVFSAFLFTIAVCRFIYKNSEDALLSFVMYICLGLFSFMIQGLRQAMAMSICLFSIEFCKKRKFFPFVLLVLLASLFHQSAIVFLVVYFIYGFKLNIRTGIASVCVSIVLLLLSSKIATIGNLIFGREYDTEVESGGFVAVAIYVIVLAITIIFSGKKRKEKDYSFFIFMTLIGFVLFLMRYTSVRIIERISYYFMFGQIIALPSVSSRFDRHVNVAFKYSVIALSLLLYVYRLSESGLVEYHFFWQ